MLQGMKGLLIGLYVPAHFALTTGHLRSAISRRAYDHNGQPVPWYTYPAIQYLATLDYTGCRVLEFGGGQSTLWWAERAAHVTTVELDPGWRDHLTGLLDGKATVCVEPPDETFDVAVIDGGNRQEAAAAAVERVANDGLIVVDNSEGYWGPPPTYPIIDLMNGRGFLRVDFHGYAPCMRRPSCTSLFFRRECRMLGGLPPPPRRYRV